MSNQQAAREALSAFGDKIGIDVNNQFSPHNALAVIEQQRAVMQKAREALEEGKHYTFLAEQYQDESNFRELADEALSLLNGCLKVGD